MTLSTKKTYPIVFILLLGLITLSSCEHQRNNGEAEAKELLDEAEIRINADDFDYARVLIDSLRNTYPRAFETRRRSINVLNELEVKETEHKAIAQGKVMEKLDSELSEIKKDFILEKDERYQEVGFYKAKKQQASSLHRTCLYAEVDENGQLFLISVLTGKKISHDRIIVEVQGEEKRESAKCLSFLIDKSSGNEEQATFKKYAEDNGIINFIAENANKNIFITCEGQKGSHKYQLSKTDAQAILQCNKLETAMQQRLKIKNDIDSLNIRNRFYKKKQEIDESKE